MNIIIVPNEPNPNMTGRHYGIAKALVREGHQVHTLMWDLPHQMKPAALLRHLFTSWRTKEYHYEELHMHKIGRLPLFWPYINGWLFKRQLRKIYRDTHADIIFAESFTNETTIPADLPFIFDLADDYAAVADVYGSAVYKLAFKVLGVRTTMAKHCQNALAVTAVSDVLRDYAEQYSAHVTKIPNGVETNIIKTVLGNARKDPAPKPHSLIYVSGFGPWSRPVEVMSAVRKLRKDFPDITLTLVGEGSEVGAIQQFIATHTAESYIDYRGFVHDRAEVFGLINQHAIGLNISDKNKWRDAAHPMKVIEYSALGKKVISTNLTGVEALGLPNIFMFDPNKSQDLERAMQHALAAVPDQKAYTAVSKQMLSEYSWEAIIRRLADVFTDSLERYAKQAIVHVTPAYPPNLGGLEKVVQVLAQTQAKLGYRVRVITSSKGVQSQPPKDSLPVTRLKSFVVANTTIMPALFTQLLCVRKDQIVHLHVTQAFTPEMVWLAAKLKGFSYVAHIHLDVPPSGFAGFLLGVYKSIFLRCVLRHAQYVIVFTKDQQKIICEKYGLDIGHVTIIANGVEDKFYYDEPRTLHTKPRLLFVGRLGYQKNLPQLLHALDGISKDFETTLLGNGELEAELKSLTKKLKLHNVDFAGRADGEALLDYYRQADIFVLTSEREGMPLVLLEAMAMGLPIVATNVTGNRDVVQDGKTGILVPYDDSSALRDALEKLRTSPTLYKKLHIAARKQADKYSWDTIATQINKLYEVAP